MYSLSGPRPGSSTRKDLHVSQLQVYAAASLRQFDLSTEHSFMDNIHWSFTRTSDKYAPSRGLVCARNGGAITDGERMRVQL